MGTTNTLDLNNRVGALKKVIATKVDKTATASGETLTLIPTSEGRALIHTAYGMSVQNGTPTPSEPVDIESAKVNLTSTHGQDSHDTTTDLTLRAIEVTSSDAYNLVRDNKYYIADTLDYSEDSGFVVTRRIGHIVPTTTMTWGKAASTNSYYITVPDTSLTVRNVKSNRFVGVIWGDAVPTGDVVFLHNAQHIIYFRNDAITSVDDWKTWLEDNALYADYVLDTPITQNITTAQALALLGLKTYDESTTISSQAEPSCTIAVEYAKEQLGALALTAYNMAKGNDLRITALEG